MIDKFFYEFMDLVERHQITFRMPDEVEIIKMTETETQDYLTELEAQFDNCMEQFYED